MTVLLDIDGVMVPAAGWKVPEILSDNFPAFSAGSVRSLNKIVAATNATILLTTSHKSMYTIPVWIEIFERRGIALQNIARLNTPTLAQTRKDEIEQWYYSPERTDNFVIIDDDKSLNNLPPIIRKRLVLTSALVGLTEELADKAIEILQH